MRGAEHAALALDVGQHRFAGVGDVLTEDPDALVTGHLFVQREPDGLAEGNHLALAVVAGLGVGWPAAEAKQSLRLPLDVTVHRNTYREDDLRCAIENYDSRREAAQPYGQQRYADVFGTSPAYGWSEDKARQYAVPERADFGAYVRARGFRLD